MPLNSRGDSAVLIKGVEHNANRRQGGQKEPAAQGQYRGAVENARGAQNQPAGTQVDVDALDHQPHADGDDQHEQQVQHVELARLAAKALGNGQGRQDREEDHRVVGEPLLPLEADDQVEQQPDTDTGDMDQAGEAAQVLEVVLLEFGL